MLLYKISNYLFIKKSKEYQILEKIVKKNKEIILYPLLRDEILKIFRIYGDSKFLEKTEFKNENNLKLVYYKLVFLNKLNNRNSHKI